VPIHINLYPQIQFINETLDDLHVSFLSFHQADSALEQHN